jgi:hypothetical protein
MDRKPRVEAWKPKKSKAIWINNRRDMPFNTEFQKLTDKTAPENELRQSRSRIQFTNYPLKLSLF